MFRPWISSKSNQIISFTYITSIFNIILHALTCRTPSDISFFFFILIPDFICADISLSSLGKNSYNSYTDLHPKWGLVSNVTTQIGTHAYLPCKVNMNFNTYDDVESNFIWQTRQMTLTEVEMEEKIKKYKRKNLINLSLL